MSKKKRRMQLAEQKRVSALAPNTRPDLSKMPIGDSGMIKPAQTPFPAAFGAQSSGPSGLQIGTEDSESSAFQIGTKFQRIPTGNSGTQIFGGYFSEEYLPELRGRQGAKKWDEMRRSESQISMLMNAIMNPIKAANWDIQPFEKGNEEADKHAALIKACLFDMIDFDTFKHESLTVVPFGFCIFEPVHSVEINHPKFGTFNGLKSIAFRSQKTIENWVLEPKTGKLIGINQYTYSDLGGSQFIPGEFLIVITNLKEGDNYEGMSALRPMLGAYMRKELYLKLAAIGVERYAIGTPIGTVPKGKEKTAEYSEFQSVLQNYTSHESSFITIPEGWKIEIQKGDFDASKIKELIVLENTEFANAVVANFLALGMHGSGSSLALGSNLLEFFTTGIQAYADLICGAVNRQLIPNLVKLNFGEQPGYPKLSVSGISDKAGKELAETIKFLVDSRSLDPDAPLKEWLRKMYKMPETDTATAVALPAIPAGASANYPKPNDPLINPQTGKIEQFNTNQLHDDSKSIRLSDPKFVKQFDANKAKLKKLMQDNLRAMFDGLKDVLRRRYNALSGSNRILAAKNVEMPLLAPYKKALRETLAEFASQSVDSAKKQTPKNIKVKLSEYDSLAPAIRKLVDIQSSLVVETQAADIEKMSFFQFTSTATTTDDIEAILFDVDSKVLPSIEGSTAEGMSVDVAAGDALAHVVNEAAMSFFMDSDVAEGIESFTLINEDPVSEICQELAGTTLAIGDPDLDTYATPLHHNCKSRWSPNFKGDKENPDIDRDGVSLSKKALSSMTLHEGCGCHGRR